MSMQFSLMLQFSVPLKIQKQLGDISPKLMLTRSVYCNARQKTQVAELIRIATQWINLSLNLDMGPHEGIPHRMSFNRLQLTCRGGRCTTRLATDHASNQYSDEQEKEGPAHRTNDYPGYVTGR